MIYLVTSLVVLAFALVILVMAAMILGFVSVMRLRSRIKYLEDWCEVLRVAVCGVEDNLTAMGKGVRQMPPLATPITAAPSATPPPSTGMYL